MRASTTRKKVQLHKSICSVSRFDAADEDEAIDLLLDQLEHESRSLPIHGEASAKATLYRDRFQLLFQRLSRDKHFAKLAFDFGSSYFGRCEVLTSWLSTKPGSPESL